MSLQNTQVGAREWVHVWNVGEGNERVRSWVSRTLTSRLSCHWPHWTHVTLTAPSTIPTAIPICPPFKPISHQRSDTITPLLYFTFCRHWEENWVWEIDNDIYRKMLGKGKIDCQWGIMAGDGYWILHKNWRDLKADIREPRKYTQCQLRELN